MEISCFVLLFCQMFAFAVNMQVPSVAIIGGGIGGTSTAYFLSELFGKENVNIDLFEAHKIGGRLATEKIGDDEFETGGSVIHTSNKYMADFISALGLKKRKHSCTQDNFGLYDGEKFLFVESGWNWLTVLKLAWRYGYSLSKIDSIIETMLSKFSRIYELQAANKTFTTVKDMLHAMDPSFPKLMSKTTAKGFNDDGVSNKVIEELVMASLLCNYGQNTSVHQFVGSVSMAGMQGALFSVEGGNKKVPEQIISHYNISTIISKVLKVVYKKNINKFDVNFESKGSESLTKTYDFVVLASPLTSDLSKLQCLNLPKSAHKCPQQGKYHRTVSTLVVGKVNSTYFEGMKDEELPTDIILTNASNFFRSFSSVNPVSARHNSSCNSSQVYKVFSSVPLTDQQLKLLFKEVESVHMKDWLAYPEYTKAFVSDDFILLNKLYYLNAIESAASAMEMSAISAKNIALLISESWRKSQLPLKTNKVKVHEELR